MKFGRKSMPSGQDDEFSMKTTKEGRKSIETMATMQNIRLGPQVVAKLPEHKPHTMAALMLGAPMSIATGKPSDVFNKLKKQKKKKEDTKEPALFEDTGDEAGPCIL